MSEADKPSPESIRAAMAAAWRDHHHARDQTWKALQMVAVLAAGLVTVDVGYGSVVATAATGVLVVLSSLFGLWITRNHRLLERRKFIHIMNCEEELGLHRDTLIPLRSHHAGKEGDASPEVRDGWVAIPMEFSFWNILNIRKHNTSLFIMRLHLAILLFAVVYVSARFAQGPGKVLGG